MDSFNTLFFQQ